MPFDLKKEVKRVSLERALVKYAGVCFLCGDETEVSINENVLKIKFIERDGEETEMVICNLHEGIFLQKLIKSYLKRMECKPKHREVKMGFKELIPKDLPCEAMDGAEMSAQEKLHQVLGT